MVTGEHVKEATEDFIVEGLGHVVTKGISV
jgi:hypothetical protein